MRQLLPLLLVGIAAAEIVDRLAVTVGDAIITTQQIDVHLRTAAMLNGESIDTSATARRRAAQKLVELRLIRSEIENNRYPSPSEAQVEEAFQMTLRQRFGGSRERLATVLRQYRLTEADLRLSLQSQLATLSFIDFRFRPGVQIAETDLRDYYEFEFPEVYRRQHPGSPVPDYDAARAMVLETMTQERIDNLLDRWLNQTETQVRIRWVEAAFAEEKQ